MAEKRKRVEGGALLVNEEVVRLAVHDSTVRGDKKIVMKVLASFPEDLQFASRALKEDFDVVHLAVSQNPAMFKEAGPMMKKDPRIIALKKTKQTKQPTTVPKEETLSVIEKKSPEPEKAEIPAGDPLVIPKSVACIDDDDQPMLPIVKETSKAGIPTETPKSNPIVDDDDQPLSSFMKERSKTPAPTESIVTPPEDHNKPASSVVRERPKSPVYNQSLLKPLHQSRPMSPVFNDSNLPIKMAPTVSEDSIQFKEEMLVEKQIDMNDPAMHLPNPTPPRSPIEVDLSLKIEKKPLPETPPQMDQRRPDIIKKLENSTLKFQHCADWMRADFSITMAAVKLWGFNLEFTSKLNQNDFEIVKAAVENAANSLTYASNEQKKNREIVKTAVERFGEALQYADCSFLDDDELALIAMKTHGLSLKIVSHRLRNDFDIVMAAVQENGCALQYASAELRNSEVVCRAAVQNNGWALQYADPRIRKCRDVVITAVANNRFAAIYAADELWLDSEVEDAIVAQVERERKYVISHPRKIRTIKNVALVPAYSIDELNPNRDDILIPNPAAMKDKKQRLGVYRFNYYRKEKAFLSKLDDQEDYEVDPKLNLWDRKEIPKVTPILFPVKKTA